MATPADRSQTTAKPRLIREHLAAFCSETTFEKLPETTVRFTKLCWMDQIGLMIASYRTYLDDYPDIGKFLQSFGGREESTVIGTGRKMPCLHAALANTAVGINDHFDAVHKTTIIHLPAALLPALLAIAERQNASGKDLLNASAVGAEVMTRFGIAMGARDTYARGFHPTSVCAPMGCAAGAGKLLGLTESQFAEALSVASVQASGSSVWAGAIYPATWSFQVARGAESGILAALLSQVGFSGVDMIFDDERGFLRAYSTKCDPGKITEGLGKTYEIEEVSFKRIGVGVYIMTSIEALIEMTEANRIEADDIESITVKLPTIVVPLVGFPGYPENRAATHLNTRYILSVTAYRGRDVFYNMDVFAATNRNDPRIMELFKKINLTGDPELDKAFPEKKPCLITITMKSGKRYDHRNDGPFRGDPENPLSPEDIEAKFLKMTSPILGLERARHLVGMINRLEALEDVSQLVNLLTA